MATRVHQSAHVGPGVDLDDDVTVGPHAVLLGPVRLHAGVVVGPGAVVGTPPEIVGEAQVGDGDPSSTGLEIGPRTVVRELATVQRGSRGATRIGADCWVMSGAYVAHDCQVADWVTLSAGVRLGGHVRVGSRANLGLGAAVHQWRTIGAGAMIGMLSAVTRDVPPYALVHGVPVRLQGVNAVGLDRAGLLPDVQHRLAEAYSLAAVDRSDIPDGLRESWDEWLATEPRKPVVTLLHG